MINLNQCLCPECKNGGIVERRGKYGKFYGCSEFSKGCTWKSSLKDINTYVANGTIKELTQVELLEF